MKYKDNFFYGPITGNFIAWFIAIAIMSLYVNGYTEKTGLMIIGLFVGSFWTINLHAYREAIRISSGKQIDHKDRFWTRLCIAGVASALIHMLAFGISNFQAVAFVGWMYLGTIFWLLFDIMLNYHRGKSLLYVSSYYATSAIDKWFSKFPEHVRCLLWLGSKILLFAAAAIIYHHALLATQKRIQNENFNGNRIHIYINPEPSPDATV